MLSIYLALFFTVALMVTTAYFILGGLPLLILDHATPLDSHFIQRFFEVYCSAAWVCSLGACISYALAGFFPFMLGCATIWGLVMVYRRTIIPTMGRFAARIRSGQADAIRAFRWTHSAALLINGVQLLALVIGVLNLPL